MLSKIRQKIKVWVMHPFKRRIAKYYLIFLQNFFKLKVIAITGSAGKTTTKEMLLAILSQVGETKASFANIDPVYNIPTTILRCRPSTRYLILEMGVEYPGEMKFYHWLAKPLVGILTNVYPTHLLYFKDVEGVYKEKSYLIKSLPKEGFAVLSKQTSFFEKMSRLTRAKVISFGEHALISAHGTKTNDNFQTEFDLKVNTQTVKVRLPIIGQQFVQNALAAAAAAFALGIDTSKIKFGLESFFPAEHRMKVIKHKSGALIIDDSYNNNPQAAKEAFKTFDQVAKGRKKVVIFGDMLELGNHQERFHKEVGKLASKYNLYKFIGIGEATRNMYKEMLWFSSPLEAKDTVKQLLRKDVAILFKASRSIGLEKLVAKM